MTAFRTAIFIFVAAIVAQANWKVDQAPSVLREAMKKRLRNIPVMEEPAAPLDRRQKQWRDEKNRRYNKNTPFRLEGWQVTHIDYIGKRQAFPFSSCDLVIAGIVENAQTYLSEDRKNLYTEFKVRIDEVFANRFNPSTKPGVLVNFDIEAGALRFASGQIVGKEITGLILPERGRRGIFFVRRREPDFADFALIAGYEIGEEYILPLETSFISSDLPWSNIEQFIASIRTASSHSDK